MNSVCDPLKSQPRLKDKVRTFDCQVAGCFDLVCLTSVLSGIFHGSLTDDQSKYAVFVVQIVLETMKHLQLVLEPAYPGLGVGKLAREFHLFLRFLACQVFQLVDPSISWL